MISLLFSTALESPRAACALKGYATLQGGDLLVIKSSVIKVFSPLTSMLLLLIVSVDLGKRIYRKPDKQYCTKEFL
jgi:hypothetical protein